MASTEDDEELSEIELWWRDHYNWLKEDGYILRPRYAPGWVPSWADNKGNVSPRDYEDGQVPVRSNVLDAIGPDGKRVCLKRITLEDDPDEALIMQQLNSSPLSSDPTNHCLPLIKTLLVPNENSFVIVVTPILRNWTSPAIDTFGEGIDFIRQLLEGVTFMHKHGFVHRDIKYNNIMMDASQMYPEGFHFVDQDRTLDFKRRARHLTRTEVPPKYYIIDFGHAKKYDLSKGPVSDMPFVGGDYSVPEHQGARVRQLCNPFKVDVYCTGNVLRWFFTHGYKEGNYNVFHAKAGFRFLEKLIADMTQDEPDKRPTMEEAFRRFETERAKLNGLKLRSRLAEKREWFVLTVARDIPHWGRAMRYAMSGLPPMPNK